MANTIQIETDGFRKSEKLAAEALYPGNWLERTSADVVQKHSTAGGYSQRMVAVEDALQGNTVATQYASGALVQFHYVSPGARIQVLLLAGENVAIGAELVSDGLGRMIATTGTPEETAGWAEEALDLSASAAIDTLITMRVG